MLFQSHNLVFYLVFFSFASPYKDNNPARYQSTDNSYCCHIDHDWLERLDLTNALGCSPYAPRYKSVILMRELFSGNSRNAHHMRVDNKKKVKFARGPVLLIRLITEEYRIGIYRYRSEIYSLFSPSYKNQSFRVKYIQNLELDKYSWSTDFLGLPWAETHLLTSGVSFFTERFTAC